MALKITRSWQRYVPEHDGNRALSPEEQVSCEYRTMTIGDVFKIQDESGVDLAQLQEGGASVTAFKVHWSLIEYVVSKYTQAWAGVTIDGEPIAAGKDIAAAVGMPGMPMLAEVVGVVVSQSMGTVDEEKNSVGQSAPEISVSATTADPASPSSSSQPATAVAAG